MTVIYDTPTDLRKRLKKAVTSREDWKLKHRESQYALKNEKSKANQLKANRDLWKRKCEIGEERLAALEAQLRQLKSVHEEVSQALQKVQSAAEKKYR